MSANERESPPEGDNGDTTARLLRLAGLRAEVPADRAARVRRAMLDECRAVARRRTIRRRMLAGAGLLAMAATVIFAVRAARVGTIREETPAAIRQAVATVERLEGEGRVLGSVVGGEARPLRLSALDTVRSGDDVETDGAARLSLRLVNGVSIRLDRGTRARLISPAMIELTEGALYVDSGRESASLELRTSFGTVRDIGTQFELRLGGSSLRVRVRSGLVEVHRGDEVVPARSGTELTVSVAGTETRTVPPYGPEWNWMAGLAPAFEIDGRPLSAFLEHLCRERGWTLQYADPALARSASGIILRGSVNGLEPADALAVVFATSELIHRLQDGELTVSRADSLAGIAGSRP